jgi:2-polyprenyl-3-methyl-5-hydroxy-6-metoxy-1,4-benzoquinol methylase
MNKITFSFGKNWKNLNRILTEEDILKAQADLVYWLGEENIRGKEVLDIGSGSGIHSLGFLRLGAARLFSFDYDRHSVEATTEHWAGAGKPEHWTVTHGSVLDPEFLSKLPRFDLVYSWGVLHHTGDMWSAIRNALDRVKPGGVLYITLYNDRDYAGSMALKQRYNSASTFGKRLMEAKWILKIMARRLLKLQNPFAWNQKKIRGMDTYHDIVDWLGGLPYEIANEDEMLRFGLENGLSLQRIWCREDCHYYFFRKA